MLWLDERDGRSSRRACSKLKVQWTFNASEVCLRQQRRSQCRFCLSFDTGAVCVLRECLILAVFGHARSMVSALWSDFACLLTLAQKDSLIKGYATPHTLIRRALLLFNRQTSPPNVSAYYAQAGHAPNNPPWESRNIRLLSSKRFI